MIYNTKSAKAIISKVHRDLQIEDQSWEIDAIEWVGEALEKMGIAPAHEKTEEVYAVESHSCVLPAGIMQLRGVWQAIGVDYTITSTDITVDSDELKDATKHSIPRKRNGRRNLNRGLGDNGTQWSVDTDEDKYYILNPGIIHTSMEEALLILQYTRIKVDDQGWPIIPDNTHSDEAIFWYIVYKMHMRGIEHPSIGFQGAMQLWERHKNRAKAKIKMPDPDEYQRFMDQWVHMVQDIRSRPQRVIQSGGTYQGQDLI